MVVQASLSTAPDGAECVRNIKNVTLQLQELAEGADSGHFIYQLFFETKYHFKYHLILSRALG
eukprot:COSAG06_NODE_53019_length_302_cov_1.019704_1_plen_62_part_10